MNPLSELLLTEYAEFELIPDEPALLSSLFFLNTLSIRSSKNFLGSSMLNVGEIVETDLTLIFFIPLAISLTFFFILVNTVLNDLVKFLVSFSIVLTLDLFSLSNFFLISLAYLVNVLFMSLKDLVTVLVLVSNPFLIELPDFLTELFSDVNDVFIVLVTLLVVSSTLSVVLFFLALVLVAFFNVLVFVSSPSPLPINSSVVTTAASANALYFILFISLRF